MTSSPDIAAILAARARDTRVLVVTNLLNGVPDWQVAQAFRMDVKDVAATFRFVMAKVKNYLFKHCKPPIPCDTIAAAKRDRVNIMAILPKLNLDKEPDYKDIVSETVTTSNMKSMINDILRG